MSRRLAAIAALGAIVVAILLPERCAPGLPPGPRPEPAPKAPEPVCPALCEASAPGSLILRLTPDGEAYLFGACRAFPARSQGWAWSLGGVGARTVEAIERRASA